MNNKRIILHTNDSVSYADGPINIIKNKENKNDQHIIPVDKYVRIADISVEKRGNRRIIKEKGRVLSEFVSKNSKKDIT